MMKWAQPYGPAINLAPRPATCCLAGLAGLAEKAGVPGKAGQAGGPNHQLRPPAILIDARKTIKWPLWAAVGGRRWPLVAVGG